jgi:hypothetical protein
MIPFGEWLPDQPPLQNPGATVATNVIPDAKGYAPFGSLSSMSGAATAYLRGIHSTKTNISTVQNFAGDQTKLYKQNATTNALDDVKRTSGAYNLASDEQWQFVDFGGKVIAAGSLSHPLQEYSIGSSTNFSDISTAPNARYIAVVKNFVVTGNVSYSGGTHPDRVRWSQLNNPTSYTIGTAQADVQDIPNAGHVKGIVGGEFGTVFCEKAIVRMQYIGSPLVFSFETIEQKGTPFAGGIAALGPRQIFYIADDGFFMFNGQQSIPIGAGKVDEFFLADLEFGNAGRITSAIDPLRQLVMWSYPSTNNSSPNKIIVYNYALGKWSVAELAHDMIGVSLTLGKSLESLDSISTSIDALTASLDSRAYKGGSFQLTASKDNKLHNFSGAALAAALETAEFEPQEGRYSMITSVSPYVTTGGSSSALVVKSAVGTRSRQVDAPTFTSDVTIDANNNCRLRTNGRYHRVRISITGNWQNALGITADTAVSGRR